MDQADQATTSQGGHGIRTLLEDARRRLLETGTRNRLVHVNRASRHSNCLNIVNERSDDVFRILRVERKKMRFRAIGQDHNEIDGDLLLSTVNSVDEQFDEGRYIDRYLETALGPDALQKRLLRLASDAKTAEEEQGINVLYLALGFLSWYEDENSSVRREAPLILLPVELVRNNRTSTYDIQCREDDITTNLPLQERLMQDFGVSLPDINESEEWTPSRYCGLVEEAVSQRHRWTTELDAMQLGFFSFAKLLMLRDLDPKNWPEGKLTENPLLLGLLTKGFAPAESLFGTDEKLDHLLAPEEIIQVIDADASQTKVIEEVRRGHNLVVQGPPGTGKSQTITNIIASAVHDGKSVLFVAEKMAALSVVYSRLVKAGLRDICVELHSRNANKKALAQELGRTLSAGQQILPSPPAPKDLRDARDKLNRATDLLHCPLDGLDYTPFSALAEISGFIGRGISPPSIEVKNLEHLSNADRGKVLASIAKFVNVFERTGPPDEHPFCGARALDLQPPDLQRLGGELAIALSSIGELQIYLLATFESTGSKEPTTFEAVDACRQLLDALGKAPLGAKELSPRIFTVAMESRTVEALEAAADWKKSRDMLATTFNDRAWNASTDRLLYALQRGQRSFFARFGRRYRQAAEELRSLLRVDLPKPAADRLALVESLEDVQRKRKLLAEDEIWLKNLLSDFWRGERTDFDRALKVAQWLSEVRTSDAIESAEILVRFMDHIGDSRAAASKLGGLLKDALEASGKPLDRLSFDLSKVTSDADSGNISIESVKNRLTSMQEGISRYAEWVALIQNIEVLTKWGLHALVDSVSNGSLNPGNAIAEFEYACAEARWKYALKVVPGLNDLNMVNRHDLVDAFRTLELDRIEDVKQIVLSRHYERLPRGSVGEMGYIRGEIARKKGHKSIRQVMKSAGGMVQRIKPVFLMSPISIAQFLPPDSFEFDLLVIDEASQVRPEDALGAIARARQIVIVGDQKQLPPTSFFDRLTDDQTTADEEEQDEEIDVRGAKATQMESILTLCEARGVRGRMLEWHYRSRDPSLIRVSNAEFYGNNLVLPPSPFQLTDQSGLGFKYVRGIYSSKSKGGGRAGTNKIEAQEIVRAVANHARQRASLSLGVVAFSKAQSNMITEVMEYARRQDEVLDNFLREGKAEDVFVKNIENVQGDERDVILISVGYGPFEPGGRLASMNFGPVNGEGGERRLNVLFSRARIRCEVFASFHPGDIDLSRTSRDGPRVLKKYLEFAQTGILDEQLPTGQGADSPFEEDVAQFINSMGYPVDAQVGSGGFRIDLGVRHPEHPGRYILAVECDGATYHSALWARERDRLRQTILEDLGWKFHRIWSTDWFYRRSEELERLRVALEAAREESPEDALLKGANDEVKVPFESKPDEQRESYSDAVEVEPVQIKVPPYHKADVEVISTVEPHEAPARQLCDLVVQIVNLEGPLHLEEVSRRVTAAFGKSRAGQRIVNATRSALEQALRETKGHICRQGEFWLTSAQAKDPPIRDRSNESGTLVKSSNIPPAEIKAAAALIESESGRIDAEELIHAVGRLLGFKRVGSDLHSVIKKALTE